MSKLHEESFLGIDIGGANLKAVSLTRGSASSEFPLWQKPDRLSDGIVDLLSEFTDGDQSNSSLAVTMTGELADCFRDKSAGVSHIVDATVNACKAIGLHLPVLFYGVDGCFHTADDAKANADIIAAANWHALASYVAIEIAGDGLLIDIGSTTCDIIRLKKGLVATNSQTDFDRLCAGELVYVGCRRTPICALLSSVKLSSNPRSVPLMNEVFATIDDAGLVLGQVSERPGDHDSADHQARTVDAAVNRISRMVGRDHRNFTFCEATELSSQAVEEVQRRIRNAIKLQQECHGGRVGPATIVLSGHGQWLLPDDLGGLHDDTWQTIDLATRLGTDASRCGPAFAVAKLLRKASLDGAET